MGAQRARASATTACNDNQQSAGYIAVYMAGQDDCTHRMVRPSSIKNPALIVQSTETKAEMVDGSAAHPLRLPGLQKVLLSGIAEVLVRLPDGTIGALNFAQYVGGRKKLSIIDGVLTPEDDYLSDLFSGEICEANCNDIESALGVKQIVDVCAGEPDTIRYQLCRIPTCCCADAEPAEVCTDYPLITEVLAEGEIPPPTV